MLYECNSTNDNSCVKQAHKNAGSLAFYYYYYYFILILTISTISIGEYGKNCGQVAKTTHCVIYKQF